MILLFKTTCPKGCADDFRTDSFSVNFNKVKTNCPLCGTEIEGSTDDIGITK